MQGHEDSYPRGQWNQALHLQPGATRIHSSSSVGAISQHCPLCSAHAFPVPRIQSLLLHMEDSPGTENNAFPPRRVTDSWMLSSLHPWTLRQTPTLPEL